MKTSRVILIVSLILSALMAGSCAGNRGKANIATQGDASRSRAAAEAAFEGRSGNLAEAGRAEDKDPQPVTAGRGKEQRRPDLKEDLQPGCTVKVRIDTTLVFAEDTSPSEARAKALRILREEALNRALPVDVHISSMVSDMYVERNARFDENTASSVFVISSAGGSFKSERVLDYSFQHDRNNRSVVYWLSYEAEIEALSRGYNSSLDLKMEISSTLLKPGEQSHLKISANEDGYLYLFDFYPDNTVVMLIPNAQVGEVRLSRNEAWKAWITGMLQPGKDYSIETLYAVFSTEPLTGWEVFKSNVDTQNLVFSGGEESFILFQKWLNRSDPARRVEKMSQIHVMKEL